MLSSGAWSIRIPANNWTFTGATGTALSSNRGEDGYDSLGAYRSLVFQYNSPAGSRTSSIRLYTNRPIAIFSVLNESESPNTAPFPIMQTYPRLQHLSFLGMFAQEDFVNLAPDSVAAFFDPAGNTYALSAARNFMTAETRRNSSDAFVGGISTKIPTLPAGFQHETILVWGQGINKTIDAWGKALTDKSGKTRPANDTGVLLNKLSYWTDNGATYYYNGGPVNYPETLKGIRDELSDKGVSVGSMQLDSWWYPKGPDNSWFSRSGIWTYTAAPNLFPAGLPAFRVDLGLPLTTHARWIDDNSPYRSQYAMSGGVSIDPKYWEDTATYLKASGVATYEQDWLALSAYTDFNLTAPDAFLDNMAAAMANRGLTIQYCMGEPKHFLQSSRYSNVTNIRTSQDRFGRERWSHFLYSGRLASALGAWPYSDVFMSSELENLLIATLSAGPVGIGDPLGTVNGDHLLRSVRADGVIVKPDTPVAPIDAVILSDASAIDVPMQASAVTVLPGGLRATYILAYPRGANTILTINPAAYGVTGTAWLYNELTKTGRLISANDTWTTDLGTGIGYYVLTAVGPSGMALTGDRDQFVTLGRKRIADAKDDGIIDLTVTFAPGEIMRAITGYAPGDIGVAVVSGKVGAVSWNAQTNTFLVNVRPDAATRVAHIQISKQGFRAAATRGSGCSPRCLLTPGVPSGN